MIQERQLVSEESYLQLAEIMSKTAVAATKSVGLLDFDEEIDVLISHY